MNNDTIKTLKGIGDKSAALFEILGLKTIEDLVRFYPARFIPYERIISIEEAHTGQTAAICATVASVPHTIRAGRLKITETKIEDYSGKLRCVWYNSPFIASSLRKDEEYVFSGTIVSKKMGIYLEHPLIYKKEEYDKLAGRLRPVYRTTKGLSQKLIAKAVDAALEKYAFEEDYLPLDIREKYEMPEYKDACINMHKPACVDEAQRARRRMVFDEFFNFLYSINKLKNEGKPAASEYSVSTTGILDEFTSHLSYKLTDDQEKTIKEIFNDFDKGIVMNRLVQGDVGSGKTVVALAAAYAAAKSGYQSVIMVPTEVLANQHMRTCCKIFEDFDDKPEIIMLTGSMNGKEKESARARISCGSNCIIIGTHALIQDGVDLRNAALVITDEQHRFGVKQRQRLTGQGAAPHVLVMSATPIPRTLAVILYGDLDISMIVTKPQGRKPVKNAVIETKDRGKAYRTILDQINAGHQAYIICPMIEEIEDENRESMPQMENVVDYTEKIKGIFPKNIVIQFLHGRMRQDEKDNIMCSFCNGDINILVSTTVIEVGVDVPNATVMMIENAERYGLATLHQLRGRVGRGDDQSYCIFVRTNDSEISRQRLEVIGKSNDGFFIASEDLRLRGPGEILGQAQSGQMHFDLADVYNDADILKLAGDCCKYVETEDFKPDDDELIRFRKHMDDYRDRRLINLSI